MNSPGGFAMQQYSRMTAGMIAFLQVKTGQKKRPA